MTVAELIKELEKMPQDRDVTMFDGAGCYTPHKVFVCDWKGDLNGSVIID